MALWLIRAGKYGEHEQKFIDDKRVYQTFSDITEDDQHRLEKEVQALTDKNIGEIDQHMASKEKEVLTV